MAPRAKPPTLESQLDLLEGHHGRPRRPPPKRALEWVLWENSAYLVPDQRREQAWRALRELTGLSAAGILAAPRNKLLELARLGGMKPELRVERWLFIAETVNERFDGDLETALALPLPKARRALKTFPTIADPGADKILLFTGAHPVPALESNGLRVLIRLGHVEESKNYSTTYRAAMRFLEPFTPRGNPWLVRAFQLLRRHGQDPCKNNAPLCADCPLAATCPSAED